MLENKILIGNIQRFCLSDGDGIRTTVFLKGCNLHCPWCSNPENREYIIQSFVDQNNITRCYGKFMTDNEVLNEILKDQVYYERGGGVTFSGGEPLLTISNLKNVLIRLKELGISMWIETSLFASSEQLDFAFEYIDNFIVDLKNLIPEQCQNYLGGNVSQYIDNFEKVMNKYDDAIIRIPLIEPYTVNEQNIERILSFLSKYKNHRVQIFKVHNLGAAKYHNLGIEHSMSNELSEDKMKSILFRMKAVCSQVECINI